MLAAVCALGLLLTSTEQTPVFSSGTALVQVVVNVTDKAGRPVHDLRAFVFAIKDDGKARPISTFARADDVETSQEAGATVEVVLLLDSSGSMRPNIAAARDSALKFLKSIPRVTTRTLVSFDRDVWAWRYDEAKPEGALDALMAQTPAAGSRLFDGIVASVRRLAPGPQRRVIVAMTDGYDEGSVVDRDAAIKALQDRGTTFYALSFASTLSAPARPLAFLGSNGKTPLPQKTSAEIGALNLQALSSASGGFVLDSATGDVRSQFARIQQDIATQYVIGFEPGPSSGNKRHSIKIEMKRPNLKVRHRREYGGQQEPGA